MLGSLLGRWFGALAHNAKGNWLATFAAFWAAAFLVPYKQASLVAEPAMVAFGLLLAAALESSLLLAAKLIPRDPTAVARSTPSAEWGTAVALAALAVAGNTFSASALTELGPATVSVVMRTEVLAVGVLGWWLLGERPSPGFWFGAFLALVGLCILNGIDAGVAARPAVAYGLLAALCFSAMQLLARRVASRVDLARVNMRRLWLSAALLGCWPGVLGQLQSVALVFWFWVGIAALCGPVMSRLLLMHSVRHVAAAQTSLVMLTAPVFALTLGFLLLGDLPQLREVLGGAVMLAGIGAALWCR